MEDPSSSRPGTEAQPNHTATSRRRASSASSSLSSASSNKPPGGYDSTPFASAPPGYTLKFTFHQAVNLPLGDLSTLSSDPYLLATLSTDLPHRHRQDPDLTFRTPTLRRTSSPEWNCEWIVANVPASGFRLKSRIYDADRADHDDRLGTALVVNEEELSESWEGIDHEAFKIHKRMGSTRAYMLRFVVAQFSKGVGRHGALVISVQCLGRTPAENGGQIYTVGPNYWRKHFSPLIGRLIGAKDPQSTPDNRGNISRFNFQAVEIQLKGPVPSSLYHRYVEFRPLIKGMFIARSLRGRFLNHALHHQHARIYNYGPQTVYGELPAPSTDLTKRFLDFVHYDMDGKIFTYVITIHGLWRFTETGKEFGIDLLSKHTLHSDVSIYIAYSGEFFVRRRNHKYKRHHHPKAHQLHRHRQDQEPQEPQETQSQQREKGEEQEEGVQQQHLHPHDGRDGDSRSPRSRSKSNTKPRSKSKSKSKSPEGRQSGHSRQSSYSYPDAVDPPTDPSEYELFIDNDSGTYRPNRDLLPSLQEFLSANLPGLQITTLDCQRDAEHMAALKEEQHERKRAVGTQMTFLQRRSLSISSSFSSVSSSEEEELGQRIGSGGHGGENGAEEITSKPLKSKVKDKVDAKAKFRDWLERTGPKDHVLAVGEKVDNVLDPGKDATAGPNAGLGIQSGS